MEPPPPPSPSPSSLRDSFDRLSLPFPIRLPLSTFIAALAGSTLGLSHGSNEASLRFRAENAHRFPSTQTGWFLYHKSKNYHAALGGIVEGLKMGARLGVWVAVYVSMEECVDRGRASAVRMLRGLRGAVEEEKAVQGSRDALSSLLAGVGAAGAFSLWNRLPVPTALRLARMGAKYGFAFGVVQDGLSLLRGRRLGYVEMVRKWTMGTSDDVAEREGRVSTTVAAAG